MLHLREGLSQRLRLPLAGYFGSGLARGRKQSQAVIVGGVSLEAAPPSACHDHAEAVLFLINSSRDSPQILELAVPLVRQRKSAAKLAPRLRQVAGGLGGFLFLGSDHANSSLPEATHVRDGRPPRLRLRPARPAGLAHERCVREKLWWARYSRVDAHRAST